MHALNSSNQAVSGGIGGFLAFFLLACALWLLMRNMNSRLRNVKYREELDAERQSAEADQDVVSRPPRPGDVPGARERGDRGVEIGAGEDDAGEVQERRAEHQNGSALPRG